FPNQVPPARRLGAFTGDYVRADVLYDNSQHDENTRFDPGSLEVGNDIYLSASQQWLTNFAFEIWGASDGSEFSGNVQARLRFYSNDSPYYECDRGEINPPQTPFFDTGWFAIMHPTNRSRLLFNGLSLLVPQDMTWTVQFQGMAATDRA